MHLKEIILNFFKIPSPTLEEWARGLSYVLMSTLCIPGKADTTPCYWPADLSDLIQT